MSGAVAGQSARPNDGAVSLELSKQQVAYVVREATGGDSLTAMLADVPMAGEVTVSAITALSDLRLSRSLLIGLMVLVSLPHDGGELGLLALARKTGLNASTTHRYLITLEAVVWSSRTPTNRRYRRAL